jgi:hypothetical protein
VTVQYWTLCNFFWEFGDQLAFHPDHKPFGSGSMVIADVFRFMALFCLWCCPVWAMSSLERVAGLMGVESESLEQFYFSMQAPSGDSAFSVGDIPALPSVHSMSIRSKWLQELAEQGSGILCEHLSVRLFSERMDLMGSRNFDVEEQRTLLLFNWVDDLIRQNRHNAGLQSAWLHGEKGFLPISQHADFPFENADVLLVLGGSSVSSLITQATFPRGRYSHAMILNRESGELVTLETLIETGAISRPAGVFADLNLHAVLVLRWNGDAISASESIRKYAVTAARRLVEQQLPYDMRMNMADANRMFCSEFVASAFASAAAIPVAQLIPVHSRVRSEAVSAYLTYFGVTNSEMISPGDLLRSGRFEVVAEFREADNLDHYWRMLLNTEALLTRLESGYRYTPASTAVLTSLVGVSFDTVFTPFRWIGISGFRVVPESLNRRALATMVTQERVLFARQRSSSSVRR